MGIQDDIFDVDAALVEGRCSSAVDAFDRVTDYIGDLERQLLIRRVFSTISLRGCGRWKH